MHVVTMGVYFGSGRPLPRIICLPVYKSTLTENTTITLHFSGRIHLRFPHNLF